MCYRHFEAIVYWKNGSIYSEKIGILHHDGDVEDYAGMTVYSNGNVVKSDNLPYWVVSYVNAMFNVGVSNITVREYYSNCT